MRLLLRCERLWRHSLLFLVLVAVPGVADSAERHLLETPLQAADFDDAATAVWGQGELRTPERADPGGVVWTQSSRPGHGGLHFGDQWSEPGPRHFRIGFRREVTIGAILLRADPEMRLSLLRADAPYPGEIDNDNHWLPVNAVHGKDLQWLLPDTVVPTRAMRFSFEADAHQVGRTVSGVYVFGERLANLAPMAVPLTSARPQLASRLINGEHHSWWDSWSNLDAKGVSQHLVSEHDPEWVMLAWQRPVTIDGVVTAWTGFSQATVQVFDGPDDLHPREADESHWRSLGSHRFSHHYPSRLGLERVTFPEPVQTRGLRLLITSPSPSEGGHPHVRSKPLGGTRVWLGELMAVQSIGVRPFEDLVSDETELQPPIPVTFTLDRPGQVTLVIEDGNEKRIRNLVADRFFEEGTHTVYWDGKDESIVRPGRVKMNDGQVREGIHGINETDGVLVQPGTYQLRGLVRDPVRMHYQTTVNHAGDPPWVTAGGTGRWLSDHSAPSDVLFLPGESSQMIISARVAESGDGVIWTDLDGVKQRSVRWLGGHWTGAYFLARDQGTQVDEGIQAYAGSTWSVGGRSEMTDVRVSVLREDDTAAVINHHIENQGHGTDLMCGLAVRDGRVYVSLGKLDLLLIIDAAAGSVLGSVPLRNPGGLAFDSSGRLLVISGRELVRYDLDGFDPSSDPSLPVPTVLVAEGLQEPVNLTLDARDTIYVSDHGEVHDVKVFAADGRLLRSIGTPGGPQVGPYDETRMHSPSGLAVDDRGRLWVAEHDLVPKRLSVWTADGRFVRAFYGPSQYGGGGTVDPQDPSRLYYARQGNGSAMEFHVDQETGDWKLAHVIYRLQGDELRPPSLRGGESRTTGPQWPIHLGGRQYMTNAFNSNPTNGAGVVTIWQMRNHVAHPVAIFGGAKLWPKLREDPFLPLWPEGVDPHNPKQHNNRDVLFSWSDLDGDGQVQPNEVSMRQLPKNVHSVFVRKDLAWMTTFGFRVEPRGFTASGVPIYDVADAVQVVHEPETTLTSGGGEAIDAGEWVVITGGPMRGYRNGELAWTYPSSWPGLHAGHRAPQTHRPGQLVATTRILGQPIRPPGTDVDIWAINGDQGQIFLLTTDGLFVATLGGDGRGHEWRMRHRERGMRIDHVRLIGEHFWPSLIQPDSGPAMLVAGKQHSSVVTIEGLESIRRIPAHAFPVTAEHLTAASAYHTEQARQRLEREGRQTLAVARMDGPVAIDGSFDKWTQAQWVDVDADTQATLAIAGDRLVAALRSRRHHRLLENTGESLPMLFKTGGALDLMIGIDPKADDHRSSPVPGDQRLLVTRVQGEPVAVLYTPTVPGTPETQAHPFSSPWRTVLIDQVQAVSEHVELAQAKMSHLGVDFTLYEWSIPVSVLGWTPQSGQRLRGDIGVLRGQDGATTQRLYWHNDATSIVEDIPTEAALTPALWGILDIQ